MKRIGIGLTVLVIGALLYGCAGSVSKKDQPALELEEDTVTYSDLQFKKNESCTYKTTETGLLITTPEGEIELNLADTNYYSGIFEDYYRWMLQDENFQEITWKLINQEKTSAALYSVSGSKTKGILFFTAAGRMEITYEGVNNKYFDEIVDSLVILSEEE